MKTDPCDKQYELMASAFDQVRSAWGDVQMRFPMRPLGSSTDPIGENLFSLENAAGQMMNAAESFKRAVMDYKSCRESRF